MIEERGIEAEVSSDEDKPGDKSGGGPQGEPTTAQED